MSCDYRLALQYWLKLNGAAFESSSRTKSGASQSARLSILHATTTCGHHAYQRQSCVSHACFSFAWTGSPCSIRPQRPRWLDAHQYWLGFVDCALIGPHTHIVRTSAPCSCDGGLEAVLKVVYKNLRCVVGNLAYSHSRTFHGNQTSNNHDVADH